MSVQGESLIYFPVYKVMKIDDHFRDEKELFFISILKPQLVLANFFKPITDEDFSATVASHARLLFSFLIYEEHPICTLTYT
jgi:hypothetical protein